jgi:hypothetical protein
MSFKRHEEIYPNDEGADHKADAFAHLSDEFPAGYSLTRCSPAALLSASPTGVEYAFGAVQLRGFFDHDRNRPQKRNDKTGQRSTLTSPFFCPKNGETLREPKEAKLNVVAIVVFCSLFGFS